MKQNLDQSKSESSLSDKKSFELFFLGVLPPKKTNIVLKKASHDILEKQKETQREKNFDNFVKIMTTMF